MNNKNKTLSITYISITAVLLATLLLIVPRVSAIDDSFEAKATATFSCSNIDANIKKLEKFTNNAPKDSTAIILPTTSGGSSGGLTFGEPISVGDTITAESPEIYWRIENVSFGPWKAEVILDGSCGDAATPTENPWYVQALAIIGACTVLLLTGYIIGNKLAKRKK